MFNHDKPKDPLIFRQRKYGYAGEFLEGALHLQRSGLPEPIWPSSSRQPPLPTHHRQLGLRSTSSSRRPSLPRCSTTRHHRYRDAPPRDATTTSTTRPRWTKPSRGAPPPRRGRLDLTSSTWVKKGCRWHRPLTTHGRGGRGGAAGGSRSPVALRGGGRGR
jgi:hypothetical protein